MSILDPCKCVTFDGDTCVHAVVRLIALGLLIGAGFLTSLTVIAAWLYYLGKALF